MIPETVNGIHLVMIAAPLLSTLGQVHNLYHLLGGLSTIMSRFSVLRRAFDTRPAQAHNSGYRSACWRTSRGSAPLIDGLRHGKCYEDEGLSEKYLTNSVSPVML